MLRPGSYTGLVEHHDAVVHAAQQRVTGRLTATRLAGLAEGLPTVLGDLAARPTAGAVTAHAGGSRR
ncbi:hypothetical protein J7F03_04765 [Streptomyces sp. ISL-43]|uniref:hypothetical protein n=1 Tax=Streptomyces sp. ISL-43 TaxID=2819183 RepID=UPI001BEA62AD|nr:hypothetical protein [Streptomyces sp. ISL-43]MBT2446406.1 hypothetical protein [Streptomyces sp. ISL-43]